MSGFLSVNGLGFSYGSEPFLAHVDLRVEAGEFLALLGSNGSGKTTLLRLLGGLLKPNSGEVSLGGCAIGDRSPAERARWVSFLPQRTPPADGFAAYEVVLMGLYPLLPSRGWESRREWRLVLDALRRVGASDFLRRPFGELSGGEQRRVLLARALVSSPRVLLLDEPLASLDPGFQLEFIEQLRGLKAEGTAIVAATHHLEMVWGIADRVLLLRRGEILRAGPTRSTLTPETLDATYGTDAFTRSGTRWPSSLAVPA